MDDKEILSADLNKDKAQTGGKREELTMLGR